jgi:hypothetical protein
MHKFDSAPWNWQATRRGLRFASNIRVADFFQEVYGWTTSTWLGARAMRGGDRAKSMAAMAFDEFCTIRPGHDEPDRAANLSQPIRGETNRTSAAAGSGR